MNKSVFANKHIKIYNAFRLAFRHISSSTNMRTIIATIIPQHKFHTDSLGVIILKQDDEVILDTKYNEKIAYLCGILNSTPFDFIARTKIQMNVSSILPSFPIPNSIYENRIMELAAKLVVGTPEFEGFAESFGIQNITPPPRENTTNCRT